jgi:hypothetical protein
LTSSARSPDTALPSPNPTSNMTRRNFMLKWGGC